MIDHLIEKISNANIQRDPFPYFFIETIFPEEFYRELIDHLPALQDYQPLSASGAVRQGTYNQRLSLPLEAKPLSRLPFMHMIFWNRLADLLKSGPFISGILDLFEPELRERFGDRDIQLQPDLGLISDCSDYAIGPHTDHPQKVLTLLFYFPSDDQRKNLGTSIYKPIDPAFRCEGFRHHPFENFKKVYSAPYIPNSLFGFFKSDRSFHGVEPIGKQESPRNSMSYQLLTLSNF